MMIQTELFPKDLPSWIFPIKRLVVNPNTWAWCKLPYPGHKSGCPNYGKKDKCPPTIKLVDHYFNLHLPLYFVFSEFDLAAHAARMKEKHPEWTDRQARCCLYWHPTNRKRMRRRTKEAIELLYLDQFTEIPEAMGVNVYATAKISGLILERIRDLNTCKHISLIGTKVS